VTVSFVVPEVVVGVLGTLKLNAGLFAGAGVDVVVVVVPLNALTGADIVPNAVPFVRGVGPGLEASCFGAANENVLGEVPVVAGVVEFKDGKLTFKSDPPAGLFAPRPNEG